jgi:hypothetical protein
MLHGIFYFVALVCVFIALSFHFIHASISRFVFYIVVLSVYDQRLCIDWIMLGQKIKTKQKKLETESFYRI